MKTLKRNGIQSILVIGATLLVSFYIYSRWLANLVSIAIYTHTKYLQDVILQRKGVLTEPFFHNHYISTLLGDRL